MAKKILAVVLAVMIALSAMAISVFAEDTEIEIYKLNRNNDGYINQQPGTQGDTTESLATFTVSFDIPVYALFGYMDSDHYMIFHLPTGWITDARSDISWSLIVNGKEWKLSSAKVTDRYGDHTNAYSEHKVNFGYTGYDYTNGYDTTIPQSTSYNDYTSLRLVATVTIAGDQWSSWKLSTGDWGLNNTSYWVQFYNKADDSKVDGSISFIRDWNPQVGTPDMGISDGSFTFVTADWTKDWVTTWNAGKLLDWYNGGNLYGYFQGYDGQVGTPLSFDHTLANVNAIKANTKDAKLVVETVWPLNGQATYTLWASNALSDRGSNWWLFSNNRSYVGEYKLDGKSSTIEFTVPANVLYDSRYGTVVDEFVIFENITLYNPSIMSSYIRTNSMVSGAVGSLGRLSWNTWETNAPIMFDGEQIRYADGGVTSMPNFGTESKDYSVEAVKMYSTGVAYGSDAVNKQKLYVTYSAEEAAALNRPELEGCVKVDENGNYVESDKFADGPFMLVKATKAVKVPGEQATDADGNLLWWYDSNGVKHPVYAEEVDGTENVANITGTATTTIENPHYAGAYTWGDNAQNGKMPTKASRVYLVIAGEEEPEDKTDVETPTEPGSNDDETEEVTDTPVVSVEPEETAPAPETAAPAEQNPTTGVALAVVPMLIAAAAAVVSKKH